MSEEKKKLIERVERMKILQEEMKKAIPKPPEEEKKSSK